MDDIIITKFLPEDKEKLAETFQHFKDKEARFKRAECYLTHKKAILAKKGNKLIGKALYYIKEDPNEGVVEFEELFVFDEYRRKGIGSELISRTIHAARKYFENHKIKPRRIFLYTGESNLNARKLYEKYGFENIANLGHLFGDSENSLLYVLDLTKKNKNIRT